MIKPVEANKKKATTKSVKFQLTSVVKNIAKKGKQSMASTVAKTISCRLEKSKVAIIQNILFFKVSYF